MPKMHELTACQREAWRRFLTAHARVIEGVDRALSSAGQPSVGDLEVLVVLRCAPDRRLRMSDLAARVALSRSGLTRQIDRLERMGLIERAHCPKDRRGTYAVLLPAGLRAVEGAMPAYVQAVQASFIEPMGGAMKGLATALEGLLAEDLRTGACD